LIAEGRYVQAGRQDGLQQLLKDALTRMMMMMMMTSTVTTGKK